MHKCMFITCVHVPYKFLWCIYRNPLASITDIVERPIIGPALCIGDHMLLWEEPPSVIEDVSPIGKYSNRVTN